MANVELHTAEQPEDARQRREAQEIQNALRGLRFGSICVIVQDGIVVQIDRTEKKRLARTRAGKPAE